MGDKETIEEMQTRVASLEKLATIGELVGGIAHEIKNPLSFITNFAELSLALVEEIESSLANTVADDVQNTQRKETFATLKENLKQILEQGKRASSIIFRMLAQARGEPDLFTLADINLLLDESAMLAYHGMRANDTTFNVKFEKSYDLTLGSFYIVQEDIGRVFLNIFNNAYYAVKQKSKQLGGTYQPAITITSRKVGDNCEIRIRDNGEGIPKDKQDKIFVPFFTTKKAHQGTGLGLALSKNIIVKGHQGTLRFESEEGNYTEFIMIFPIRSAP